jgi:hypothetical protein
VLAAGGVWGVGDKMFALPLSKLHRDAKGKLVAIPIGQLADGATFEWKGPDAHLAAPPRNPPPTLAFGSSEATKGTASAVNPAGQRRNAAPCRRSSTRRRRAPDREKAAEDDRVLCRRRGVGVQAHANRWSTHLHRSRRYPD